MPTAKKETLAKKPAQTDAKKPAQTGVKKRVKKQADVSLPVTESRPAAHPAKEINGSSANCFSLWLNAWKQTFSLKGRSSRYELWSFLLINTVIVTFIEFLCIYILSSNFLRTAHNLNYSLNTIDNFIITAETVFYFCLFLPLFPLGALLIRRMHDLNHLAWRGFLEPVFMGTVMLSMLHTTVYLLADTNLAFTILLLGLSIIFISYAVIFYGLKFAIMTLFYPGSLTPNAFGDAPEFNTAHYEDYALTFSCWFFILILTLFVFLLTVVIY